MSLRCSKKNQANFWYSHVCHSKHWIWEEIPPKISLEMSYLMKFQKIPNNSEKFGEILENSEKIPNNSKKILQKDEKGVLRIIFQFVIQFLSHHYTHFIANYNYSTKQLIPFQSPSSYANRIWFYRANSNISKRRIKIKISKKYAK